MKAKIRKVTHTKNPSIQQMRIMTDNLGDKFNRAITVDIVCWHYSFSSKETIYRIYVEGRENYNFDSWSALLDKYEELMKEKPND